MIGEIHSLWAWLVISLLFCLIGFWKEVESWGMNARRMSQGWQWRLGTLLSAISRTKTES